MSIDRNEVRTENMPPYPHSKKDTVIPPPEHRDDRHEKKGLWVKIGIGAAALAVTVGGYFAVTGGDKATEPKQEPNITAPADPTAETPEQPVDTPEVGVGIEGTTYETVNSAKAIEFIDRALEPIPGSLSEEEAIIQYGHKENIYKLSGVVDDDGNETPESQKIGEAIQKTLYGKNHTVSQNSLDGRASVAIGLHYLNEVGAAPEGKIGTYHISYEPVEKRSDGWWLVDIVNETNFYDLDAAFFQNIEESASSRTVQALIKPQVRDDGTYGFSRSSKV